MLDKVTDASEVHDIMLEIGRRAKRASKDLALASNEQKNQALQAMAESLEENSTYILDENEKDMSAARNSGMSQSFQDRLLLDTIRLKGMIEGLHAIAELKDPVGDIIAQWDRPNGLKIERVRTPLGVIGVIFESRPNVTVDAAALCLKSGNAVILRAGSDSYHSSRAIYNSLVKGLEKANLPRRSIQIVPTTNREAVGEMLTGLNGNIDVIVPRGGRSLVERVQKEARVPVFAHLEGLCHVYVDDTAEQQVAVDLVVNSKMRRTGICGSAETLLIDVRAQKSHVKLVLDGLKNAGCEIRGDDAIVALYPDAKKATDQDWKTEYLDSIISVRLVDGIDEAIAHIRHFSSGHTEAIISNNAESVEKFMNEIDSAILLHNASTQFADGGEFGMGAEIGIATGKMHARGPVGVEQLTSFKYRVHGDGQIRP